MLAASPIIEKPDRRHADEVAALLRTVLESPGVTDPAGREAAFRGRRLQVPLDAYVAKVQGESFKITDQDVESLLAAGLSQDAIFEITVAAALGAAARRLEAGLAALRQGG